MYLENTFMMNTHRTNVCVSASLEWYASHKCVCIIGVVFLKTNIVYATQGSVVILEDASYKCM